LGEITGKKGENPGACGGLATTGPSTKWGKDGGIMDAKKTEGLGSGHLKKSRLKSSFFG